MAYHDSSFIPPAKKEAKNMPATAELSVTELQMMLQCLTLTLTLTPYYECNVWGYAVLPEVDISCRACSHADQIRFARLISSLISPALSPQQLTEPKYACDRKSVCNV